MKATVARGGGANDASLQALALVLAGLAAFWSYGSHAFHLECARGLDAIISVFLFAVVFQLDKTHNAKRTQRVRCCAAGAPLFVVV